MHKTILITGSTDGIGLELAKRLVSNGHRVLLHGRDPAKLAARQADVAAASTRGSVEGFRADLSSLHEVEELARAVAHRHPQLDVLINNAGVFRVADSVTPSGHDVRFVVNTFAPYLLTQRLLPSVEGTGRVVNLSSAAQAPVDLDALAGRVRLSDSAAYAQSKLALTMWSRRLGLSLGPTGPLVVAVNPGSMLGTKMVEQAYGVAGADVGIGVEVLERAALSDEFADAAGQYFDNDSGQFAEPHPDALDEGKASQVVTAIEAVLAAPRAS